MNDQQIEQLTEEASDSKLAFGRAIGLFLILLVGLGAAAEALRMGVLLPGGNGVGSAGPGMFPFITAFGVIAFSFTALVSSLVAGGWPRVPSLPHRVPRGAVSVACYIGALGFYALVLGQVGFAAATAITVGFILRFAEGYRWTSTIVITIITVCLCYVLFNIVLGAHLPSGRLWR